MKRTVILLASSLLLVMTACGDNQAELVEIEDVEAKENELKEREEEITEKEKELSGKEEEFAKKNEELQTREEKLIEKEAANLKAEQEKTSHFDDLPLPTRVHLATAVVDDRAFIADLTGYTLYYNIVGEELFVIVHSGVGLEAFYL